MLDGAHIVHLFFCREGERTVGPRNDQGNHTSLFVFFLIPPSSTYRERVLNNSRRTFLKNGDVGFYLDKYITCYDNLQIFHFFLPGISQECDRGEH